MQLVNRRGSVVPKLLLVLCATMLGLWQGYAAFSVVNQATCTGTKKTCQPTYTPTAGNFAILTVGWNGGSNAPTSITETNVTWVHLTGRNGSSVGCDVWYVTNIPGSPGANPIINFPSNVNSAANIAEWSGAATSGVTDGAAASDLNAGSTTPAPTTFSTSHIHDLIYAMTVYNSASAPNADPTGFTPLTRISNGFSTQGDYKIVSATGSFNPQWTLASSVNWCAVGQGFKDTSIDPTNFLPRLTTVGAGFLILPSHWFVHPIW